MSSLNKVILLGNLGRDPELVAKASTPVCKFSIATTHGKKNASGQWENETDWHNIVAFGNSAENIVKYCKKGRSLLVEGRLTTRKWQDKEGNDRYTTEVIAENVKFIGKGDGAATTEHKSWSPKDPVNEPLNVPPPPNDAQYDFGDFDIPF